MRSSVAAHDALARLLTYPAGGLSAGWPADVALLRSLFPEAATGLDAFLAATAGLDAGDLEELYARTFDHSAERSLEIGWQLFGESYARGVLLVRLRALLREHGVPEGTELPDHLLHVLPLLGRAPEPLAGALATGHVLPAVAKILDALSKTESPWVGVLEAVRCAAAGHRCETSKVEVSR